MLIVRTAHRVGPKQIYLMNPDGSVRHRLIHTTGCEANPAWSPDGPRLAFTRALRDAAEIYIINADGTDQRQLTK